jgi:hypothetical protein
VLPERFTQRRELVEVDRRLHRPANPTTST